VDQGVKKRKEVFEPQLLVTEKHKPKEATTSKGGETLGSTKKKDKILNPSTHEVITMFIDGNPTHGGKGTGTEIGD